jgi:glycosyltransferase involved in cell wall biosynthesis
MANRSKVFLVTPSLGGGGAERFSAVLSRLLNREGYEACLVSVRSRNDYAEDPSRRIYTLGKRSAADLPRIVHALRRRILEERPGAVLGVTLYCQWMVGMAIAGMANPPRTIGRFAISLDHEPPRDRLLFRMFCGRFDRYVANCEGLRSAVSSRYPRIASRTLSILNPVETDELNRIRNLRLSAIRERSDSPVVVASAGRLAKQKRFDLLLQAFASVSQRRTPGSLQLWILGEGPLRPSLAELARRLHVENVVHFRGFHKKPWEILAGADIFALTSDAEGSSNALVEAQMIGYREIVVHGETGLLCPVGEVAPLSQALRALVDDPSMRLRMGTNAAIRSREKFDAESIVAEWKMLLRQLGIDPA